MSALLSFLGGSVFRMLWAEIASWYTKKQDHEHELALLRAQAEIEDAAHRRRQEQLETQARLGIKTIEAQSAADIGREEAAAFGAAVAEAFKPTGIKWVDGWNGIIRPAAATICLVLWSLALWHQGFRLTEWDQSLVGVILGFWFANRVISRSK